MKKQILILAATFSTVAFISCSKGDIDIPEKQQMPAEEQTAANKPGGPITIDPLSVGLKGWYKFSKDLKDATGKLPDGIRVPAMRGGAMYTFDRKGVANAALKFDGNYYVTIDPVPVQQNMSLSVWVKRGVTYYNGASPIIRHNSEGIALMQNENGFWARVLSYPGTGNTNIFSNDFIDEAWHHIVINFSADEMTMYVDGQLQGKTSNTFTIVEEFTKYLLGYSHGNGGVYWKGAIDELRFYGRTLTATEVQQLLNK